MTSSFRHWTSKGLSAVFAAMLACLLLAGTGRAQALKLATIVPEGSIWDKAERSLGSEIEKATDRRVSFRIYPGGVAGDEPDMLRKLRAGQLQAALFSAPGLGDIDPAFLVFQVPLLFETDDEVRYVLEQMRPEFEKRLEDKGLVLLHWGNAGWMRIFSSKSLENFEEFKQRKQFVWGNETRQAQWFRELGMQPVTLAATDVLTGLQTGLIEALPVTPLAALSLQWFRSAPYTMENRFAPLLGGLIVSKRSWDRIKPEDREAMTAKALETEEALFREIPRQEADALAEMQKRGLKVSDIPPADEKKWIELGNALQQRFRANSVPPEIFDRVVSLLEEHRKGR